MCKEWQSLYGGAKFLWACMKPLNSCNINIITPAAAPTFLQQQQAFVGFHTHAALPEFQQQASDGCALTTVYTFQEQLAPFGFPSMTASVPMC